MSLAMFEREWLVDTRVTDAVALVDLPTAELVQHLRTTVTKALHCAVVRHSSGPVLEVRPRARSAARVRLL